MDKKTDIPGMYKTSEGFLINKDENALKAYKLNRAKVKEIESLKEDVTSLKDDLKEIKELLRGLVK